MTNDLDRMQSELEIIANLTQGSQEKISYMKDSATAAQKSSPEGITVNMTNYIISLYVLFYYYYKQTVACIESVVQLLLICCWYWTFISDLYVKKASSMLDDILRFEKTIISQEQQIL